MAWMDGRMNEWIDRWLNGCNAIGLKLRRELVLYCMVSIYPVTADSAPALPRTARAVLFPFQPEYLIQHLIPFQYVMPISSSGCTCRCRWSCGCSISESAESPTTTGRHMSIPIYPRTVGGLFRWKSEHWFFFFFFFWGGMFCLLLTWLCSHYCPLSRFLFSQSRSHSLFQTLHVESWKLVLRTQKSKLGSQTSEVENERCLQRWIHACVGNAIQHWFIDNAGS